MSQSKSDEQSDLTRFQEEAVERPSWEPGDSHEPDTGARVPCEKCEGSVTLQFARVFGNNEDRVVNGCPDCSTYPQIRGEDRVK